MSFLFKHISKLSNWRAIHHLSCKRWDVRYVDFPQRENYFHNFFNDLQQQLNYFFLCAKSIKSLSFHFCWTLFLFFFAFTTVYVFGLKNQTHLFFLILSPFLRLFFFLSVRLWWVVLLNFNRQQKRICTIVEAHLRTLVLFVLSALCYGICLWKKKTSFCPNVMWYANRGWNGTTSKDDCRHSTRALGRAKGTLLCINAE